VSVATTCVYGAMANPLFLNNVFTLPLFTEPALYFQVMVPPRAARTASRLGAPGVLVLTTPTWPAQSPPPPSVLIGHAASLTPY